MARANDKFSIFSQGEPLTRCSSLKYLHKERGDFDEVAKRTFKLNQGKDYTLSSSHENLVEMKSVGFLIEEPMMDFLSPQLAAKDRSKCSSLPSLGKQRARNLPPASEHFEMVASKMFDRAPNVQNGKGVKNQLATKLPRKINPREGTKNTICHLEDSFVLTLSAPSLTRLSRSQDCLRRKALLRPSTVWSGSKSVPNSPPQVKKVSHLSYPSSQSRHFTEIEQEDTAKRRGSCPNVSSCTPSPPASPSLRRRVVDRTDHGAQVLIEHQRCPPSSANTGAGRQGGGVNAKSLSVPSCKSAPNSPSQVTKASHLSYPSRRCSEAEQGDSKRRDSCPNMSSNMPPVSLSLRRKLETSDRTVHGARMLIDEHRRCRPGSANSAGRQAGVSAKSLSVALDEVKNCRYLRIVKKE